MDLAAGVYIAEKVASLTTIDGHRPDTTVCLPAVVAAVPDAAGEATRLLLAGNEPEGAAAVPVLFDPYSRGFRFGSPAQAGLLLGALVATCVQELPPVQQASLRRGAVATPLSASSDARRSLALAAGTGGIGSPLLVSEPAALAAWAAELSSLPLPEQGEVAVLTGLPGRLELSLFARHGRRLQLCWCAADVETEPLLRLVEAAAPRAAWVAGVLCQGLPPGAVLAGPAEVSAGAALIASRLYTSESSAEAVLEWTLQTGETDLLPLVRATPGTPVRRVVALEQGKATELFCITGAILPPMGARPVRWPAFLRQLPAGEAHWLCDLTWDGAALHVILFGAGSPVAQPETLVLPWP